MTLPSPAPLPPRACRAPLAIVPLLPAAIAALFAAVSPPPFASAADAEAAAVAPAEPVRAAPSAPRPAASLVDGLAAIVDGKGITIAEVMRETRHLAELLHVPSGDSATLRKLYAKSRDHLVERQLILHAYEAGEAKLPEWVAENRASEIIEERFGGDRSRLASELAREHLTVEEWRERLEEELILGAMRQANVDRRVSIRPADVRAAFATNSADSLVLPGTTRVSMIQLRPVEGESDEAFASRAAALRDGLAAGGDFALAARRFSRDSHARAGGDWGYVEPADEFREEIVEALDVLPEGGISAPIHTPAGTFIVKKTGYRPDRKATFEDFRESIENGLREQESERLYAEWIGRLKADARVQVFELPEDPGAGAAEGAAAP